MKLLAIDTTTEACSAALDIDGDINERFMIAPRRHGELILPMIDGLLADAGLRVSDLDGLVFARGPGAFTGIRIAAGVIQGIALGSELPVLPVSTLAALAQGASEDRGCNQVVVALDARMGEVYWGGYRTDKGGLMRPNIPDCLAPPAQVPLPEDDGWLGVGSGWTAYGDILRARMQTRLYAVESDRFPRAATLCVLGKAAMQRGESVTAGYALPIYLRERVVAPNHHD